MIPWERRIAGVLGALRLDSIRNKLIALVLVATLVPTLTTASLSYFQNKRAFTDKVNEELQSVGSHTARELDLWVRQVLYDVGVFSSSFEVTENLEWMSAGIARRAEAHSRLEEYVSAVNDRISDYKELLVLNTDGEMVAANRGVSESIAIPEEAVLALESEDTWLGEPQWHDRYETVVATLAEPIHSASTGEYLGALVALLDLDQVSTLLKYYSPDLSGKAYLVTDEGRIITSSEGTPTDTMARIEPSVLQALASNPEGSVEYPDVDSRPVLGTMQPIPGRNWSVIAEVDRDEAYASINRLRNMSLLLVSLLLGTIGVVTYLLGLFIVRPLARLTEGAAEVAAGDLSVDLPITGGGEVADLTVVFNDMVQRLRSGREELERLSITDGLTGLTNHRRGMEVLSEAIELADLDGKDLALLMMDVDQFKRYNDEYGHLQGDEVLRIVAEAIKDGTRGKDTACRYGGEEFMVVLPSCDAEGAMETARRVQDLLAAADLRGGPVTMSIGAAVFGAHGTTEKDLIQAADQALYRAKEEGRNRTLLAMAPGSGPKEAKASGVRERVRAGA